MSTLRRSWPIVVGGCHRSGTSLVRRILNAHSRIFCGPEVKFFRDFFADYKEDPIRRLRFFSTARAVLSEEELLEIFGKSFVALHDRAAAQAGKSRWADKNPENVLYLPQWQRLLGSEWLMIHVMRNPLDTLASMKEASFPFSLPDTLDGRIEFYQRYTKAGIEFGKTNGDRYYALIYEKLVDSPEPVLRDLMAWLGDEFEPGQLDFNKENQPTPGLEDRKIAATRKIHRESVGRWSSILNRREIKKIRAATDALWSQIDPAGAHRPSLSNSMLILKQNAGASDATPAPFIVGVGRSGTTLLRMMLDAHPQLAIPPETHFIPEAADACRTGGEQSRDAFVNTLLSSRFWTDFQLDPDEFRKGINALAPFDVGAGLRVFYRLYAGRFGKTRWGDKTPTYLTQMQLIAQLLPEAASFT